MEWLFLSQRPIKLKYLFHSISDILPTKRGLNVSSFCACIINSFGEIATSKRWLFLNILEVENKAMFGCQILNLFQMNY